MQNSPENEKLEKILRSSRIVAGGFMGNDDRPLADIIEQDKTDVKQLNYSLDKLARRMSTITDTAKSRLGLEVNITENITAYVDEAKGSVICPWPHQCTFEKRLTTVKNNETNEEITWSDLNIHMIEEHGFFEGRGSRMRIEPDKLIRIIFEHDNK